MTITYDGNRNEYSKGNRMAEIFINDETEQEKLDKVCKILSNIGWEVTLDFMWASVIVSDQNDYRELMADYKKAKKETR